MAVTTEWRWQFSGEISFGSSVEVVLYKTTTTMAWRRWTCSHKRGIDCPPIMKLMLADVKTVGQTSFVPFLWTW